MVFTVPERCLVSEQLSFTAGEGGLPLEVETS